MFEDIVYLLELRNLTRKWVKSSLKGFTVGSTLMIVRRGAVNIDGMFGLGQPLNAILGKRRPQLSKPPVRTSPTSKAWVGGRGES